MAASHTDWRSYLLTARQSHDKPLIWKSCFGEARLRKRVAAAVAVAAVVEAAAPAKQLVETAAVGCNLGVVDSESVWQWETAAAGGNLGVQGIERG